MTQAVDFENPVLQLLGQKRSLLFELLAPLARKLPADGELLLRNVRDGKEVARLEGHEGEIKRVLFNETGDTLISWSTDKSIRIRDVASKKLIRRHDHDRNVNALAVHENLVAFGDFQGGVCLLDLEHGRVRMRTGGHYVQLAGVAFSDEGSEFYTVALDGFFKTWSTDVPPLAIQETPSDKAEAPASLRNPMRSSNSRIGSSPASLVNSPAEGSTTIGVFPKKPKHF